MFARASCCTWRHYVPWNPPHLFDCGCRRCLSTMGQLTVKDYKSSSGERVLAGQAQPKVEYRCEQLSQESQPWGLAGNMNRDNSCTRRPEDGEWNHAALDGIGCIKLRVASRTGL